MFAFARRRRIAIANVLLAVRFGNVFHGEYFFRCFNGGANLLLGVLAGDEEPQAGRILFHGWWQQRANIDAPLQ